jgi:hypothetical protein
LLFRGEREVLEFQTGLATSCARFGEFEIELQQPAMMALMTAALETAERGSSLTARAADSGRRSYDETVRLWQRNVNRGIDHWRGVGRLSAEKADAIRGLDPIDQVEVILELEENSQLFFSTYFDKSILYSVAAPGSSQHLSLLAFDVAEYQDRTVELIMNRCGWYRTVINDLPHFTFMGMEESELPGSGLIQMTAAYPDRDYAFWVPDITASR